MPESPRCPKCSKPVYTAEERVAAGAKWHKFCYKCGLCNKMLDSVNVAEHEGQLFCKICYGRKHGPKGYGFGMGAGTLNMDLGAQFGNTSNAMGSNPQTGMHY